MNARQNKKEASQMSKKHHSKVDKGGRPNMSKAHPGEGRTAAGASQLEDFDQESPIISQLIQFK
jgi:hypothetical protein